MERKSVKTREYCAVCGDGASGRHYGVPSCEGCKGFFKRSIRKCLGYQCRGNGGCTITKRFRNRCQFCRFNKCLNVGMKSDSVQHERKPLVDKREQQPNATYPMIGIREFHGHSPRATSTSMMATPSEINYDTFAGRFLNQQQQTMHSSPTTSNTIIINDDIKLEDVGNNNENVLKTEKTQEIYAQSLETLTTIKGALNTMTNTSTNTTHSIRLRFNGNGGTFSIPSTSRASLITPPFDFHLPLNNSSNNLLHYGSNMAYIREMGSRLLYLTVQWSKNLFDCFDCDFDMAFQETLLCQHWVELFILGLMQCSNVLPLPMIMTACVLHVQTLILEQKLTAIESIHFTQYLSNLQDYINAVHSMQIDEFEYAYMKTLIMFAVDQSQSRFKSKFEKFQEDTLQLLDSHLAGKVSIDKNRKSKLILRLSPLRGFNVQVSEELFLPAELKLKDIHVTTIMAGLLKADKSCATAGTTSLFHMIERY